MVMWTSTDQGHTWTKQKQLTHDNERNHSFARQPLLGPARLLRPVGRRQRASPLGLVPLLHRSRRHARLAHANYR